MRPGARSRPGPCASLTKLTLRIINYVMLLTGVAMIVYSLYVYQNFRNARFPDDGNVASDATSMSITPGYVFDPASSPQTSSSMEDRFEGVPWFVFAFGSVGAFVVVTSLSGICAADCGAFGSRCCLTVYICLALVMVAAQMAVIIACFVDRGWEKRLPHDRTGQYEKMKRFVEQRQDVCKWTAVAVTAVQVMGVVLACTLYSINESACELEEDMATEEALLSAERSVHVNVRNAHAALPLSTNPPDTAAPNYQIWHTRRPC